MPGGRRRLSRRPGSRRRTERTRSPSRSWYRRGTSRRCSSTRSTGCSSPRTPTTRVIIIVGHDDPETAAVAHRVAGASPDRIHVITDTNERKSKPKALNTALPHCRGDVVGVFDAEDQVHPELLEHVDHAFRVDRRRRRAGRRSADQLSTRAGTACRTAWNTSSGSAAACTCTRARVSSRSVATRCS